MFNKIETFKLESSLSTRAKQFYSVFKMLFRSTNITTHPTIFNKMLKSIFSAFSEHARNVLASSTQTALTFLPTYIPLGGCFGHTYPPRFGQPYQPFRRHTIASPVFGQVRFAPFHVSDWSVLQSVGAIPANNQPILHTFPSCIADYMLTVVGVEASRKPFVFHQVNVFDVGNTQENVPSIFG